MSVVLGITFTASLISVFSSVTAGALSDRYGHRAIMAVGIAGGIVLTYPFLRVVGPGETVPTLIAFVALYTFAITPSFAASAMFLSEQFDTGSRRTGASLGFQLASTLGGGFAPVILASLLAAQNGGLGLILAFVIGTSVLSALAVAVATERRRPVSFAGDAAAARSNPAIAD